MLTINTNLSSLIAQGSMKQSTNKLNQAIERMTTGFKINHAKDNAANYSIATNMTTKIGAYNVAEDNAAMGLDLISTAEGTLSQIEDKLQRLRALAEQASNGTYGEQSLNAINAEANALVDEIERIYNNSEYNGINLMKGRVVGTEESKFIKDIDRRDTSKMTTLASVDESKALTSGTYSISTAEELAKLATMTNNGLIGTDTEFVLANDIDLQAWCDAHAATGGWEPIGIYYEGTKDYSKTFQGVFDGNGYEITNLVMNPSNNSPYPYYYGLFGFVRQATIKNVGISSAEVMCTQYESAMGNIVGYSQNSSIENCYVQDSSVKAYSNAGLIAGNISGSVLKDCYSSGEATATYNRVGGLAGTFARSSLIENCFSSASIVKGYLADGNNAGGLVGYSYLGTNVIKNSAYIDSSNTANSLFVDGNDYSTTVVLTNCYTDNLSKTFVRDVSNDEFSGSNIKEISDISEFITLDSKVISHNSSMNLQVGINSSENSCLSFDIGDLPASFSSFRRIGVGTGDYLTKLDRMLAQVSEKQTHFGATSNRLESVLEEITIQRDNLVSSRSTIRDADIAEVSSHYIQQQILQQASATLLATANQSPSIALQLI